MAVVAGWGWRQRIRRRHFTHLWFLRLNDWTLECTRCHATKPDPERHLLSVPRADELDYVKENQPLTNPYAKAIAAIVGAIAATVIQVVGADTTWGQVATIVVAVLTALGVYAVPNRTVA
jgi:hypothetical protein